MTAAKTEFAPASLKTPWLLRSRWRLLAALILTIVVPMTALFFVISEKLSQTLKTEAKIQNQASADFAKLAIQEHFLGLRNYLESYANRPRLVEALAGRSTDIITAQFQSLVLANPAFDRVFFTDTQGTEWFDYPHDPAVIGKNFAFRDWFQGVSASEKTYISEIYQRAARPKPFLVSIATPVLGAEEKMIGYLVGQHTIESLTNFLQRIQPTSSGKVALIDHHGNLAMKLGNYDDPPLQFKENFLVRRALQYEKDIVEAADFLTGKQSLISFCPVPEIGWAVFVIQPLSAVLLPAKSIKGFIWGLVLLSIAGMLAFGFLGLNTIRRFHEEKARVEEALRQANENLEKRVQERTKELSAKNTELENLLHITAHDLKEPLRGIESFSSLLRQKYEKQFTGEAKDFLERLSLASGRMRQLLDHILTLSRMRKGVNAIERIHVHTLVQEILERLRYTIEETQAKIRILDSLPIFYGEKTFLTQAIYNLIANSLKFAEPGSNPEIEIEGYTPGADEPGMTGIVVRDRGIGVDPQHREMIFQLFKRAVSREIEGTGAGLSITKAVAQMHGGGSWMRPRAGGGSEFFFTIGKTREKEA